MCVYLRKILRVREKETFRGRAGCGAKFDCPCILWPWYIKIRHHVGWQSLFFGKKWSINSSSKFLLSSIRTSRTSRPGLDLTGIPTLYELSYISGIWGPCAKWVLSRQVLNRNRSSSFPLCQAKFSSRKNFLNVYRQKSIINVLFWEYTVPKEVDEGAFFKTGSFWRRQQAMMFTKPRPNSVFSNSACTHWVHHDRKSLCLLPPPWIKILLTCIKSSS